MLHTSQTPQPFPLPPVLPIPGAACYTVEILRPDRAKWRVGVGTLTECEDVLESLADLPAMRGAVLQIRRRIKAGVYADEPVKMVLNLP